jgi:fatty acid amide hydrolase
MERSCGGSSGGEAALIAAGASPLGLGNDIGGSLRIPAAFCGIASIRPTAGRTPDRCGHGLPIGQQAIVSQVGPMAKRVEDLVMALRIIERGRDPLLEPGPELGDPASVEFARLRFATFTGDGEFPVAPAARRAVAEAAQMLIAAGAKRVEWRKPALSQVNDLFFACLSADRGSAFKRMLRGNRVDGRIRSLLLTAQTPPCCAAFCAPRSPPWASTTRRRWFAGSRPAAPTPTGRRSRRWSASGATFCNRSIPPTAARSISFFAPPMRCRRSGTVRA